MPIVHGSNEKLIQLLQELDLKKSLRPEIRYFEGGKRKHVQLKNLTSSIITRRISKF
jgi:hypothetical protein